MKRFLPVGIAAVIIGSSIAFGMMREYPNPDPNHTHADFAVWVNGTQLDFSGDEFMSKEYVEGQALERDVNAMRKFLHLHDGNGQVVHRHKPGLTFGDFLTSIGFTLENPTASGGVVSETEAQPCVMTPDGSRLCNEQGKGWLVLVNNAPLGCRRSWGDIFCGGPGEEPVNPGADIVDLWKYAFEDEDQILVSYGQYFEEGESGITPDTRQMMKAWAKMTNDACKYSKTCPWRGEPPTENCIADPTVPCVAQ